MWLANSLYIQIFFICWCFAVGIAHVHFEGNALKSKKRGQWTALALADRPRIESYIAAIVASQHYLCSGTLITPVWVVTAATPVFTYQDKAGYLEVRLSSHHNLHEEGASRNARNVIIHPYYAHDYPEFDIALVRMDDPVNHIAALPNFEYLNKKKFSPKSYKVLSLLPKEFNFKTTSNTNPLRVSDYRVQKRTSCHAFMAYFNITLTKQMLCLKTSGGDKSSCTRDAGAGIFKIEPGKVALWGVISGWKPANCSLLQSPALATRLSTARVQTWIDQNLKPHCTKKKCEKNKV